VTFRLDERAVRGVLGLGGGSSAVPYTGLSTDTRTLARGALFVALAGERFDGHDFLEAARDAGAAAAVVRTGTPPVAGLTLHEVPDTLHGWGLLARARRRTLPGPVVAITGTNGKTATKEMVAAVLRTRYRVWATRANLNNLVGVPQTIIEAPDGTEALVVEAGANRPGEIARYREIIEPDIAIVTNAAPGHLEGFGTTEAVVEEKLALTRDVPLALVGMTPPTLAPGARARGATRVVTVGLDRADLVPDGVELSREARPVLHVDGQVVRLPLLGRHQALNALFAWGVVRELDLDRARAARALEAVILPPGRGEVIRAGELLVVNDAYNANPDSFRALLTIAGELRAGRRLVIVAGTMLELGRESSRLHAEVASALVEAGPDLLAAVGEFVPALAPFAEGLGSRLVTAPDVPTLGALLADRLRGDELVLLKASRGMALEHILPAITGRAASMPEA
jgi:UDP-N-acetylmuramoyl-tripeptide--D-alanyl-D-alanine ligase